MFTKITMENVNIETDKCQTLSLFNRQEQKVPSDFSYEKGLLINKQFTTSLY